MLDKLIQLNETAWIENLVDPLPSCQLALFVLLGNGLFPSALCSLLSLCKKLLTELINSTFRHT